MSAMSEVKSALGESNALLVVQILCTPIYFAFPRNSSRTVVVVMLEGVIACLIHGNVHLSGNNAVNT